MSTSTEDLGSVTEASNLDYYGSELLRSDNLCHENIMLRIEGLPLTIPSDQKRMIQNIITLIAELPFQEPKSKLKLSTAVDLGERSVDTGLVRRIISDVKASELNKELTRRLESQTQTFELLMSQSMANENIQPRLPDLRVKTSHMPMKEMRWWKEYWDGY